MGTSEIWQISAALLLALLIFVLAYGQRRTWAIGLLLILIPFQAVETRYASSSVVMTYVLAAVLLLNGEVKVRMLASLGLMVLAYLISLSQADRTIFSLHLLFFLQFFSCLLVFLLAYNFARLVKTERTVVDVLLAMNAATAIYCLLQLTAGPGESFAVAGIEWLSTHENRGDGDARLIGPFGTPGTTAGYLTLMILVCIVELMFARGPRRFFVTSMVLVNVLLILATANRGAFLVLIAMFPVVLFAFRRELGGRRVVYYSIGGVLILAVASAVVSNYTDFGRMYERMATVTETENGVPMTRRGPWPAAVAKIKEDPWLGEGPYYVYPEAAEKLGWTRTNFDDYPHSLYLYLLRTVGVVGLVAVLWFFVRAWWLLFAAQRSLLSGSYQSALVRVGLVLIPAFLLDQIRLEFLRQTTMDFGHFIFGLVGLLIGVSDRSSGDTTEAAGIDVPAHTRGNTAVPEEAAAGRPS